MRTRRSPRNQQRLYKAIGAELAQAAAPEGPEPAPYVKVDGERVYDAVKRLGIPHSSHYSDLYLPNTRQVHEILKAHGVKINGHTASYFRNQVDGGIWIDLPFAYLPYWDARTFTQCDECGQSYKGKALPVHTFNGRPCPGSPQE